jgi:putative polyhydroxyalkanoate system protein
MAAARSVAQAWSAQAQTEFGMQCRYEEGPLQDTLHFSRAGVRGSLRVAADCFEVQAVLGFLLGSFKDQIEAKIVKNLDALLQA